MLIVANLGIGEIAVEAFTCLLVFKNMFSFVLTFYAYKWFAHGGIKHTMIIIGSIQVGICCLSLPMCMFPHLLANPSEIGSGLYWLTVYHRCLREMESGILCAL